MKILSIFAIVGTALAQDFKIFAVSNPAGWPVLLAVEPANATFPDGTRFNWSFNGEKDPKCTVKSKANVTCEGRVVDYVFTSEGKKNISLTISHPTLIKQEIKLTTTVEISSIEKYEKAYRPEIRSIPINIWQTVYIPALYKIKDLGIYDHLTSIHRGNFPNGSRPLAHSSPTFLTWHRSQSRVFERALQVASGYDNLGIPYWDWILGYHGLTRYLGPTGNPRNNFIVPSGPFCYDSTSRNCSMRWLMSEDYPHKDRALRRNIGEDAGVTFLTQEQMKKLLDIPEYDKAPYNGVPTPGSFRNALEGWLSEKDASYGYNHNGIHRWIGGTMGEVAHSVNDPIFLIHHANVDRLFTMWQQRHNCSNGTVEAKCFRPFLGDETLKGVIGAVEVNALGGGKAWALPNHMRDDKMYPWGQTSAMCLKANEGYEYLESGVKMPELKQRSPPPPPAQNTNSESNKSNSYSISGRRFTDLLVILSLILIL